MYIKIKWFVLLLLFCGAGNVVAQDLKTNVNNNKELDSLRKVEEQGKDSIVYNAKYIRYTKLALTKDSIVLLPLDTTTVNIQNYSPLLRPKRPTISTGVMGSSAKDLLYDPNKSIGFDAGFHALDYYSLTPGDVSFYQARAPFTSLYFVSSGKVEQLFRAIHTQNIKENWNAGVNFNRADSRGQYAWQRGDNLNVALFTWYKSPNKRYNLWATGIWNNLRTYENGSVLNDSIFAPATQKIDRKAEEVSLRTAKNIYRKNNIFLKQTYYVGRIDSSSTANSVLPTNKISHTLEYNNDSYGFSKNEIDFNNVLPKALRKSDGRVDSVVTNDSTHVQHIRNEFMYSFFLRAKNSTIIKNELKLDVGLQHDLYTYQNLGIRSNGTLYEDRKLNFQNITILGNAGYRFSNKMDLNFDVRQIVQGRNAGDFLYEAKSHINLSKTFGRVELGAYIQNKSPEELFNYYNGNYYSWNIADWKRTKIVNLSFDYINDKYGIVAGAKYFLTTNYLYFAQSGVNSVTPQQETNGISLIRFDISKKWNLGKFVIENYLAYQKTDANKILRTPEFYTYNSAYWDVTLFKVLKMNIGFDVRYNTSYSAYSYAPILGQFYIGDDIALKSTPVVDVFIKANLKRANLFVKYDYINQGFGSKGYYTVNRYPMQDGMIKFGVTWNFYD